MNRLHLMLPFEQNVSASIIGNVPVTNVKNAFKFKLCLYALQYWFSKYIKCKMFDYNIYINMIEQSIPHTMQRNKYHIVPIFLHFDI